MDNNKKKKDIKNGPALAPQTDNDQIGENRSEYHEEGFKRTGNKGKKK